MSRVDPEAFWAHRAATSRIADAIALDVVRLASELGMTGASTMTLHRRASYGGRKGRRAAQRLRERDAMIRQAVARDIARQRAVQT